MSPWLSVVLASCAVAITIAAVLAVLSARRALVRTEAVLAAVEREMTPLAAETRSLTQEVTREVRRAGDLIEQVHEAARGVGRVVAVVAGFTRAGQWLGLVAAFRRGAEVFVERLRTNGGNHRGQ